MRGEDRQGVGDAGLSEGWKTQDVRVAADEGKGFFRIYVVLDIRREW